MDPYTMNSMTICACSSRTFIPLERIAKIAALAEGMGIQVNLIPDLCEQVQEKDETLRQLCADTVVACHERAVRSLLDTMGIQAKRLLNNRTEDAWNQIVAEAKAEPDAALVEKYLQQLKGFEVKQGKDAWYPTLDKQACIECEKCHDFCPFGVYELVDFRVRVMNPTQCKNNCPACARNCPAGAIIFPKYTHSPINGGVEMEEEAVKLEPKKVYANAFRERLEQRRAMSMKFTKSEDNEN